MRADRRIEAALGNVIALDAPFLKRIDDNLAYGDIKRIIKKGEKKCKGDKIHLSHYVSTSIRRACREKELMKWLDNNPDPYEVLTPEEFMEDDPGEMRAYCKERATHQSELDGLMGTGSALSMLVSRMGRDHAQRLWSDLWYEIERDSEDFEVKEERLRKIVWSSVQPEIRHPDKYIHAVIANRKAKIKKRQARERYENWWA